MYDEAENVATIEQTYCMTACTFLLGAKIGFQDALLDIRMVTRIFLDKGIESVSGGRLSVNE